MAATVTLSQKTLEILESQKNFKYLFAAHSCAGHKGIINWYDQDEIVNFISSLGDAQFAGLDLDQWDNGSAILIFNGHEIDYVLVCPKQKENWRDDWGSSRESAGSTIIAEGDNWQIVKEYRCTASTGLQTRRTTYLYVQV